jgi:tRNA A-37 threonylcarbamoyl transferase component Bud32
MPSIYVKTIKYADRSKDRIELEIELQKVASQYNFCPKIIDIDYRENECVIKMENLNEDCIANKYGEEPKHISSELWDQIHKIIAILYEREGIEYVDITPYNFIEKEGKVYIIDFGDAYYRTKDKKINWFLEEFLGGLNEWNPDFK